VIFKEDRVGGRATVIIDEEPIVTRLNRNQVVEILRLVIVARTHHVYVRHSVYLTRSFIMSKTRYLRRGVM